MSTANAFDLPNLLFPVFLTHLQVRNQLQTACYVLYCYDHLLVFSDEVEQIWKQPFNISSLLYSLNRGATHMLFIAIQAGLSPKYWTDWMCDYFSNFRGACTIVGFGIAQMTLLLRTYALYGRSAWLLGGLLAVLTAQAILMAICVVTANAQFNSWGCVAVGTVSYYGAIWIAPLVTDTLILVAILLRMRAYRRAQLDVPMAQQICRDGISYYLVILSANMLGLVACCAWTVGKPDATSALLWSDLTTIGTPFAQIITSLVVARLQLDLRARQGTLPGRNARPPPFFALANLGGD